VVRPPAEPGFPASLALGVLVAIAVVAPWPFGAVLPGALLAVAAVALLAGTLALVAGAGRGGVALPAVPLWPLAGFVALALLQLVPLPEPLHALLAPGSHAVWRPAAPEVAAVLGTGPRPVSVDPDTTLRGIALTGGLALLALLAAPALSRPDRAVRAVAVVGVGGVALSAYAIFARARFGALLFGTIAVPTVSPFGPFVSKNHFAGWIAMAALLAAGLAVGLADRARGRGGDWTTDARAGGVILSIAAALAMALGGLASLSRGGTIALAAGALCFVALRFSRPGRPRGAGSVPRGRRTWSSLVLAGVLGAILAALVPPEAHERMRSLSGASFRLDTWRDTLRLAASSPLLGHGLGAFHDAYPRFKRGHAIVRVEHAENDYLESLAETGGAGLALALLGFGLVLAAGGRGIAEGPDRAVRGIGTGALAALAALAVHSAVDFNLRIPSNAALAALAAAAAAGAAGVRPRPLPRAGALGLAAGALVLLVSAASRPGHPWLAARQEVVQAVSSGAPAVRRLRLERAEGALVRVLERRPAQAESWLLLAGTRAALGDAASGAALARHAAWLDPERPGLAGAADRLSSARTDPTDPSPP
jgi:O-antigen ligase